MSDDDLKDLAAMWSDGVPINDIAAALGKTRRWVAYRAVKYNLGRHPLDTGPRHRITAAVRAKIMEMREAGAKLEEIADAVGFSISAISEAARPVALRRIRARKRVQFDAVDRVSIPDAVLIEREKRYSLAPRDLTAAFFGDPLPGYSHYDRVRR
jgi:hypothetical protein